mmetsp:Transcript_3551/g.10773  ORF Transcript_3551/g.10773 Transcript_3551/m.10773 type:complete len:238 (-) Transcript_3551:60-773(-)
MHGARAGEVDDAAISHEAARALVVAVAVVHLAPRRELASAPHHVHHGRVDEARECHGVADVGREGAPLGDGAGDDSRRRARERVREEPRRLGVALDARRADGEEGVGVDEAVVASGDELVAAAAGERVARGPPRERGDGRVEEVLDEDILRVLLVHRADLEHSEAGLHPEDEDAAEDEPEGVHVRLKVLVEPPLLLQIGAHGVHLRLQPGDERLEVRVRRHDAADERSATGSAVVCA